jgi:hypothetical protein
VFGVEQDQVILPGGIAMTVTKSYVARNYGVRDRIIDNLAVGAAVLMVVFVLLFLSGAMDFGRDISVQVDQASMEGPLPVGK